MSGGNVIFSSEAVQSTEEIGRFLVNIGEKLIQQGAFTLMQGDQELQVTPSGNTKLELQYKTKGDKHEFEIEIEWKPGQEEVLIK